MNVKWLRLLVLLVLLLPVSSAPAGRRAPRPVLRPPVMLPGPTGTAPAPTPPPPRPLPPAARWSAQLTPLRALWVWGDESIDLMLNRNDARARLYDQGIPARVATAAPVTLLFMEDPADLFSTPRGRPVYTDAHIRSMLADLHVHGIEVHLIACAHPGYSSGQGCMEQTVKRVLAFNQAGTADTAWDGIQLAVAPVKGELWRPYAAPPALPAFWDGLKAAVETGSRQLHGRMPLGLLVGPDWQTRLGGEAQSWLTAVDYVAILPFSFAMDDLFAAIEPWLPSRTRFLLGFEVGEGRGPGQPPVWDLGYRPLESILASLQQSMALNTPLVGVGFSSLEPYLRMPAGEVETVEGPPVPAE